MLYLLNRLERFESITFHIKTAKQEDVRSVSLLTNLVSPLCALVIYLLRVSRDKLISYLSYGVLFMLIL